MARFFTPATRVPSLTGRDLSKATGVDERRVPSFSPSPITDCVYVRRAKMKRKARRAQVGFLLQWNPKIVSVHDYCRRPFGGYCPEESRISLDLISFWPERLRSRAVAPRVKRAARETLALCALHNTYFMRDTARESLE